QDIATPVGLHAGLVQPQVVRVGHAAYRQKDVRADYLGLAFLALYPRRDACSAPRDAQALCPKPELDAFGSEDRLNRGRNVLILASDQPRSHFHDSDAAAEATVHLRELEPDVAAADHDQMIGQEINHHDS